MIILNEELYAKNILLGKCTDVNSIIKLIGYITRYNYYVLNKDDETNYRDTVRWLSNTQKVFDDMCYSAVISKAIRYAAKHPFYKIQNIEITISELNSIKSLDNLRAEKVLFVLLCMAKQQAISRGFVDGLVQYIMTDLYKMARISVPKEDREYILHKILKQGLISCPKKNDTKCLKVNFVNDDEAELILNEMDCQELAYVYLNWRDKKGFRVCSKCGRLFKIHKEQNICRYCNDEIMHGQKLIYCIDCGQKVFLKDKDTATCRCNVCQEKRNIELNRIASKERMQHYRNK